MRKYLFAILFIVLLCGCSERVNHQHILCEVCGKCVDETCASLDDKCLGHQKVHKHTLCEVCGKCIDETCDSTEDKCLGHQEVHEHTLCEVCGKCVDETCDSTEDKCLGHQEVHEHTLCLDCGGCVDSDCDGTEENRCYRNDSIVVNVEINNFESFEFMHSIHVKGYHKDSSGIYIIGLDYIEETVSYLPQDIAEEYGINIVVVTTMASHSTIYVFYQNEAFIISSQDSYYKMISHIAITDFNHDNYYEITFGYYAYYRYYERIEEDFAKRVVMFDTKTKTMIDEKLKYVPYFKVNENDIEVFGSIDNNPENATEYLYKLIPNYIQFEVESNEFLIEDPEFSSIILFDTSEISFPIRKYQGYFEDLYVTAITKWKGETFSYMNYYERRPGFEVWFLDTYINNEIEGIQYISSDSGVRLREIYQNDILLDSCFFERCQFSGLGTYNIILKFEYIENKPIKIVLDDVLTIKKKYIQTIEEINHSHIACDKCGKCIAEFCDGGYREICHGHS